MSCVALGKLSHLFVQFPHLYNGGYNDFFLIGGYKEESW